jgi:hypothetical protein
VLLAATHSVAVLVRTRAGGVTYWCALLMTLALASCAFVLSFDALRSLAVTLGLPEAIAWLWPCAIDVAIAQATLCLLSLSRRTAVVGVNDVAAEVVSPAPVSHAEPAQAAPARPPRQTRVAEEGSQRNGSTARAPANANREPAPAAVNVVDTADIERWQPVAESIVAKVSPPSARSWSPRSSRNARPVRRQAPSAVITGCTTARSGESCPRPRH